MASTRQASEEIALSAPGRVLLVDDQPELRRLFRRSLNKAGFVVVEAWNGRVAIELTQQVIFDVVISDVHMPDMSGIELLQALREQDPDLPVVLTSGSPGPAVPLETEELGAYAYLVKPVAFETMRDTARGAVALRRARAATMDSGTRLRVPRHGGSDF